ncbi:chitinase [Synchytrium microbalum]|uniref:Chitinase n=1 Tax=Synchytrium microbalum TaxID=1806994 RepID=A0A507BUH2_9FUNG|nr:chitinase [Synchytrium microbalum]TPX30938.1 chitinase [Synchytrium microbalum]
MVSNRTYWGLALMLLTRQCYALVAGDACPSRGAYACSGTDFMICTLSGWLGPLSCGPGQECLPNGVNSVVCALAGSGSSSSQNSLIASPDAVIIQPSAAAVVASPTVANQETTPAASPYGYVHPSANVNNIAVAFSNIPQASPTPDSSSSNSGSGTSNPTLHAACSPQGAYACANDGSGDFYICGAASWIGPMPCGSGTVCVPTGQNSIVCGFAGTNYAQASPNPVAASPYIQVSPTAQASVDTVVNPTQVSVSTPSPVSGSTSSSNTGTTSASGNGTYGKRVVGYLPNWTYWQTHVGLTLPATYGAHMTHVNHAFASLAYSPTHDVWYVMPSDPQVDYFISVGNDNAASGTPTCLDLSKYTCGSQYNPGLSLVPYIGAGAGSTCPVTANDCYNPAGTTTPPGRGISCFADVGAYLKQGKYACGYMGYYASQLKKQYPNIKVLLSLGGWYDSNSFSSAVSPKYIDGTVKSISAYLTAMQMDGVDIDWEYPGYEHGQQPILPGAAAGPGTPDDITDCTKATCAYPGRTQDGVNFVLFLQKLKAAMPGKLVTIAGAAGQDKMAKYDMKAVCNTVDFINLMTYDMNGAWSAYTNHQAPLFDKSPYQTTPDYSTDNSIQYLQNAGCAMDKVVLGIPFYARVFNGVTKGSGPLSGLYQSHNHQGLPGNALPSYSTIMSTPGWTHMTDSSAVGALSWNDATAQLASYDNPTTISTKGAYLKKMGLGGFMYWALGMDTSAGDLFTALVNGLN